MASIVTSCYRCVGETHWVRYGRTLSGKQRMRCKECGRTSVITFSYNASNEHVNAAIVTLTKEGLGIRATARVLRISATTVLKRLVRIAEGLKRPVIGKGQPDGADLQSVPVI